MWWFGTVCATRRGAGLDEMSILPGCRSSSVAVSPDILARRKTTDRTMASRPQAPTRSPLGGGVHTKRLIRMIVTPGPLMYALFGFMAGLAWLSLTTLASSLPETPHAVSAPTTAHPPPAASTCKAPSRASADSRGSPICHWTAAYRPRIKARVGTASTTSRRRRQCAARTSSKSMPPPVKSSRRPCAIDGAGANAADLTIAQAEQRAAQFARTHFWGFDQLQIVDRSTRASDNGPIHSFKWTQITSDSGAELPISVSIAVSGRERPGLLVSQPARSPQH